MNPPKRRTVNAVQAAEFIGCCRTHIYKIYEAGKVEGYRIGSRQGLRLYLDSLNDFIQSREGE